MDHDKYIIYFFNFNIFKKIPINFKKFKILS